MGEKDQNTENKILTAAQDVFIQKGMNGTRMQEIADKAGINKALLHYYYRSKEKLFLAVFRVAISVIIPKIEKIFSSDKSLFDKLRIFVEQYGSILYKNQFIPLFILHEINRNPDALIKEFKSLGIDPNLILDTIRKEIDAGIIKPIDPRQLAINMLSMIIFPIAGRPMLQRVFYNNDKKLYNEMLKQRLKEIPEFVINSIKA